MLRISFTDYLATCVSWIWLASAQSATPLCYAAIVYAYLNCQIGGLGFMLPETMSESGSPERQHPFERILSVSEEDIELFLHRRQPIPWSDFLLNPRRLRGSDFLMRWSQGQWSEDRLVHAVNATGQYIALPYGPSGVAPDTSIREFELYFERLEAAGLGQMKRPDLLIFRAADETDIRSLVDRLGGLEELPFIPEERPAMAAILARAVIAVECENSLWVSENMPDFGKPLRPMKRLNGKPGLAKGAVVPTVIIKEEDRNPLRRWQSERDVPIHIWHVFFDHAYGICFDKVDTLIAGGEIEATTQTFQAPGGATSEKSIYKVYYHHAYHLAEATTEPDLVADYIKDKNGHILPYVKFSGGSLRLLPEALEVLNVEAKRGK